jgi:hypothetical protein
MPSHPYFHLMDYCTIYNDQWINLDINENILTSILEEILIPSLFGYLEPLDILKKLTVLYYSSKKLGNKISKYKKLNNFIYDLN